MPLNKTIYVNAEHMFSTAYYCHCSLGECVEYLLNKEMH